MFGAKAESGARGVRIHGRGNEDAAIDQILEAGKVLVYIYTSIRGIGSIHICVNLRFNFH